MEIHRKDLKLKYFKSSGPGGQHKNKKFTSVKIIHAPTGISAVATEQRSQAQNKEIALERLKIKIKRFFQKRKKRIPVRLPNAIKERMLESKKRHGDIKRLRQRVKEEKW
ncbi:MAG: peptide chain release factor-like protein [Candidatus Omnitrophota bacterium]